MTNPLVSVVLPSYNRPEQTVRAVHSVLNQTYRSVELIVVDDGSETPLEQSSLWSNSETIRSELLHLDANRGVSHARNRGAEVAQGEWLAFLDSDDEWLPEKLELQMNWLRDHPEYLICQTQEQWIRNGVPVKQPKQWRKRADWIFAESLQRCMVSPSSVIIHRSLWEDRGPFDESYPACEDYDLWLKITRDHPVGLVDQKLMVRYGGAEDQLSMTVPVQDRYRIAALENILHEDLTEEQREQVVATIVKKTEIVANGFLKRGKVQEAQKFVQIADKYKAH